MSGVCFCSAAWSFLMGDINEQQEEQEQEDVSTVRPLTVVLEDLL